MYLSVFIYSVEGVGPRNVRLCSTFLPACQRMYLHTSAQTGLLQCSLGRSSSQFYQTSTINPECSIKSRKEHVTPLFINLHWLPIAAHIKIKALMCTSLPKFTTLDLCVSLHCASEWHIIVPSQRGTKSLSLTFIFTVPCWWDDLSNSIWAGKSLDIFKKQLKTSIFHLHSLFYFYLLVSFSF